MNLWSQFLTNDKRRIFKWKHYFPAYERHFSRFRNTDVVFIEIGCGKGGSLQMWKEYFGPHARIVGIDIKQDRTRLAEDQIDICIGDQSDPEFLKAVVAEFGPPDVVLDDGSHMMSHITQSFQTLYPLLSKNGVYAVEDLHTAYWDSFEGGHRREGSFIETCKDLIDLIDELNAFHTHGAVKPTPFTMSTLSMHIYDSMIIFEKGRHTKRMAFMTGT